MVEPWLGYFKTLGRTQAFIDAELAVVATTFKQARSPCATFNVASRRALALMFDIVTQNGTIAAPVHAAIQQDISALPNDLLPSDLEVKKATYHCEPARQCGEFAGAGRWSNPQTDDCEGTGTVHGRFYDLASQFDIGLRVMQDH